MTGRVLKLPSTRWHGDWRRVREAETKGSHSRLWTTLGKFVGEIRLPYLYAL